MKKVLVVVDMQEDFIYGSLGSEAARAIVPNIKRKIEEYLSSNNTVIFTRDTHRANYLETQEGKFLPVPHCIHGTKGWCVIDELEHCECQHIDKYTFGYTHWDQWIGNECESIELCGVLSEICVISNALVLKAVYPNVPIFVDNKCCAGASTETHEAAMAVLKSCQINVV